MGHPSHCRPARFLNSLEFLGLIQDTAVSFDQVCLCPIGTRNIPASSWRNVGLRFAWYGATCFVRWSLCASLEALGQIAKRGEFGQLYKCYETKCIDFAFPARSPHHQKKPKCRLFSRAPAASYPE